MAQRLANNKKIVAIIAITAFSLLFSAYQGLYSKNTAKGQHSEDTKPLVDVLTIQRKDMTKTIDLTGQTVPESQVDIAAKYTGKITQINVQLGQHVTPGQVLLSQDSSDIDISIEENNASFRQANADAIESNAAFEANYQKAQSDYQHSVTTYERYKLLYSQGAISKEVLDNAEQQLISSKSVMESWSKQLMSGSAASVESKRASRDKAQSVIDALKNQKDDLTLRAPRSGMIGFRQAEVGNIVSAGQIVLSIVDNSNIYIDCSVSEQDIGQVVLGLPTTIEIESLGKSFTGKIIYISPSIDSKTQAFTIRMILDKPEDSIRSGMFARTKINTILRSQTLFVPKEAVLSLNGKDRIFVVNSSNQVEERIVQLGLRNDKSIEIISGMQEGETIAVSNLAKLKTGTAITPNNLAE
ncbi:MULTISPECIES: efflux RND transporter periplasmic adaptor subunit [Pelosinus]|uniref:Efflux transporter, RND family, MFP subunit n=1 Tax=Pelosinus fermentans B4 TaxID=1149862 RepID=I9AYB0_9FIRM|nr:MULTISPECIES: efflux RND transporter periplasmic adaptor subunit [Pelosinus]EIW17847.1 efflux transporter, RND family, MFP subunit [Pelosinus fermentans B4]EIW23809.1 efflux transporter, RND family, MFP subunit [Pelosinus fermentans A11]OAM94732.1 efflux transporter, RND family, MFP subunit [Pelosinus fermentans DSM 17108]SDR16376.1 RND family efflux transporter, MFP subunit [Pelosinus fermentans]